MSEAPRDADPGADDYPGMPRWVKVLGVLLAALILLILLMMVWGGGGHGPWRHMP